MERSESSRTFGLGSLLPQFTLPSANQTADMTDTNISVPDFFSGAPAGLIVFTCNHCPYVKGSEAALITVVSEFLPSGLKTLAISSNDAKQYPEDSFERMQQHAAALKLPYPYLYDETQAVAKLFDAACTPECYLFDRDRRLVFHGTINNSPRDPSKATEPYLMKAITQVLEGKKPEPAFVHPIGCSIKWK